MSVDGEIVILGEFFSAACALEWCRLVDGVRAGYVRPLCVHVAELHLADSTSWCIFVVARATVPVFALGHLDVVWSPRLAHAADVELLVAELACDQLCVEQRRLFWAVLCHTVSVWRCRMLTTTLRFCRARCKSGAHDNIGAAINTRGGGDDGRGDGGGRKNSLHSFIGGAPTDRTKFSVAASKCARALCPASLGNCVRALTNELQ